VRGSRLLLPLQVSEQMARLELFWSQHPDSYQAELIVPGAKMKQGLEISPARIQLNFKSNDMLSLTRIVK
jgi:hypothetical protein